MKRNKKWIFMANSLMGVVSFVVWLSCGLTYYGCMYVGRFLNVYSEKDFFLHICCFDGQLHLVCTRAIFRARGVVRLPSGRVRIGVLWQMCKKLVYHPVGDISFMLSITGPARAVHRFPAINTRPLCAVSLPRGFFTPLG